MKFKKKFVCEKSPAVNPSLFVPFGEEKLELLLTDIFFSIFYFYIIFATFSEQKSTLNRLSENSQRENSKMVKVFGSNLRGREPVISQSARRKFSSATSGKSAWEK